MVARFFNLFSANRKSKSTANQKDSMDTTATTSQTAANVNSNVDRHTDTYELALIGRIRSATLLRSELARFAGCSKSDLGRSNYFVKLAAGTMSQQQWQAAVLLRHSQLLAKLDREDEADQHMKDRTLPKVTDCRNCDRPLRECICQDDDWEDDQDNAI